MSAIDTLLSQVRDRQALPPPAVRRQIRRRSGLSKADIGRALGVSRQAVAYWENGTRQPGAAALHAYRDLLERLEAETS